MKKYIKYILCWCVFLMLFFSMNSIIGALVGNIKRTDMDSYQSTAPIYCTIDSTEVIGDFMESVELYGWAFCENTEPNTEKTINLLLSDGKRTYQATTELFGREDLNAPYGSNHGFRTAFSTVGIPNGTYELSVFCKENEKAQAAETLNYFLIKSGKDVSFMTKNTAEVAAPDLRPVEDFVQPGDSAVHNYLDMFELDGQTIRVKGWAFCETENINNEKQVQILFKHSDSNVSYISDLSVTRRLEIYFAFRDAYRIRGMEHGFEGVIPTANLVEGVYDLYLICNETSTEYGITNLNRRLVVEADGSVRMATEKDIIPKCETTAFDSFVTTKSVYCSLDYWKTSDDYTDVIQLGGWALCGTQQTASEKQIKMVMTNGTDTYEISANTGIARKDIYNIFSTFLDINGENLGFSAEFCVQNVPDGEYKLYLYCQENENDKGIASLGYSLTKTGETVVLQKITEQNIHAANRMDSPVQIENTAVIKSLDVLEVTRNGLRLSGRAFCETQNDNSGKRIQILFRSQSGLGDYVAEMDVLGRIDLYLAFKDKMEIRGVNHGYDGVVSLEDMPADTYDLYLICRETDTETGMTSLEKSIVIQPDGSVSQN